MHNYPATANHIRLLQPRDLEVVHQLGVHALHTAPSQPSLSVSWLPSSLRALVGDRHRTYVLESGTEIVGWVRVSPINSQRTAWQIEAIAIDPARDTSSCGTQLIRHCLEVCYEARNWLVQVDVNQKEAIALYRHNGFQPLAHLTSWEFSSALLLELAQRSPDLPNLLPVSNSDATLLYQLDTAAMPPQLRQVYDLSVQDFRTNSLEKLVGYGYHLLMHLQEVSGYVYEPQRKAAIGYFDLVIDRNPHHEPIHHCQLTVHPAYTWLYPELMVQVANATVSHCGTGNLGKLRLTSADYQPEREAYLEQMQAERLAHSLLMARSVWHKVRETRPVLDALQLSRMLAGLQPAHKPVPGRIDS